LWTTGWATLTLLLFHALIDRRGWPALGRRFGMNAIAAYAGSELMQILLPSLGQASWYRALFADWMTPRFGPFVPSLAFALVFVVAWWLIVWAMDRRRLYLKL
jgi:predicted acyltransferase